MQKFTAKQRYIVHMEKKFIALLCLLFSLSSSAQENLLKSGPMVGYSDFREALIWVQTTETASVKIGYFTSDENEKCCQNGRATPNYIKQRITISVTVTLVSSFMMIVTLVINISRRNIFHGIWRLGQNTDT